MKSAEEFIKEHGKLQLEKPENKKIENNWMTWKLSENKRDLLDCS